MCATLEMAFNLHAWKNKSAATLAAASEVHDLDRKAKTLDCARGAIPARPKPFTAALLAAFLAVGLPYAAHAQAISFNFRAQNLLGYAMSGARTVDQSYDTPFGWGVTFLVPEIPVNPLYYTTSAGSGTLYYNFFNTLNRQYPTTSGWTVTGNATPLAKDSLQISTYGAIGTPAAVGADIAVNYITRKLGPTPGTTVPNGNPTSNIRWIQVVADNNAITYPGGVATSNPGMLENVVDVVPPNSPAPYDPAYAGALAGFVDTPRRPDVMFENSWIASLFLVSGPSTKGTAANPATITLYNDSGILWGWQNFFFPFVDEQQFVADVEQDVFGRDMLGNINLGTLTMPNYVNLIPTGDYASYQQAFLAGGVPEPASWAMLMIGFGSLGYAAYHRGRKNRAASAFV